MQFESRTAAPGCILFTCQGEVSWEDRETLPHTVEQHLHSNPAIRGVILDFTAITFVNSAGLGALFQLVQRLRGRGAKLVIVRPAPPVQRLFAAVGLDRVTKIAADLDSAVSEVSDGDGNQEAES